MPKLRSEAPVDLIGVECKDLPNAKLPTVREVLLVFYFHLRVNHDVRGAARIAVRKVSELWAKTKIPVIQEIHAISKIEVLHKEWRDVRRHSSRSETAVEKQKKEHFIEKLDKLFDLAKQGAIEFLEEQERTAKNPEDKEAWKEERLFLLDQRDSRLVFIGGVDDRMRRQFAKSVLRQERKVERSLQLKQRQEKDQATRNLSGEIVELESDPSDEGSDELLGGSPVKRKRGRRDMIAPEVVEAIDAAGLSSRQAADILSAATKISGVDLKETNINKRSIQRKRKEHRTLKAAEIKKSFKPDAVLTIHWDGKKVQSLAGKTLVERQALIVTGVTTNQILGAPVLANGSASEISAVVLQALKDWNVEEQVKAMAFDTTSVNTGSKNGAALKISTALGRDLLWLPCRHHIFERVLEEVFHTVMGASTGPKTPIFNEFQRLWPNVDQSKFSTFQAYAASRSGLSQCEDILKFALEKISSGQPRDDYLELLELTVLLLRGEPPRGVRFRPPGPIHSARWMAKAIYALKMCLFRKQAGLQRAEADRLLRIAIFVVRLYIPAWFTANDSISSPRNDLNFLKNLIQYESVDKVIAKAAQKRFLFHLWYLSEELLGFAVFDETLSFEDREKLMESIKHQEGTEKPPKKRNLDVKDVASLALGDLATSSTMRFFNMLEIDTSFFQFPVASWSDNNSYKEGKEKVTYLQVVNDHAERVVKLMTDFNRTVTRDEDSFQNLLISVQSHRKSIPDDTKRSLVALYAK